MPNMSGSVKVPVLGNVPKPALIIGLGGGALVTGYLLWKRKQAAAAPTGGAYGYGASAYGYGSGFYGYGTEFAYGGSTGGGITPYPIGSEYGYGSFGYGYYNPYTGQYLGGSSSTPPGPTPTPTPTPVPVPSPHPGGNTHTVTANGKTDLYFTAKHNGITEGKLVRLNPHLSYLVGSKKPIPRGTRVKV